MYIPLFIVRHVNKKIRTEEVKEYTHVTHTLDALLVLSNICIYSMAVIDKRVQAIIAEVIGFHKGEKSVAFILQSKSGTTRSSIMGCNWCYRYGMTT